MKRKLLTLLLAVAMMISMMPMNAFAIEGEHTHSIAEGKCTECGDFEVTLKVAPSTANITVYDSEDTVVDDIVDNGVDGSYHMYKLYVPQGRYRYSGVDTLGTEETSDDQNIGGMYFDVPFADEVISDGGEDWHYSGNGLVLTLARVNFYCKNSEVNTIGDYELVLAGGVYPKAINGDQYLDTSINEGYNTVVTPVLVTARGNALVYQMNFKTGERLSQLGLAPKAQSNLTWADATSQTVPKVFTVDKVYNHSIVAPSDANVQVFNQINNFNVEEMTVEEPVDNGDGTSTWTSKLPSGTKYSYRVSKNGEMTQAGYFSSAASDKSVTVTFEGNPKTTESNVGSNVSKYEEASTMVNVNGQNNLNLAVNDTFKLRSYRGAWQIIDTITTNVMIEPDFNYNIISGDNVISLEPADDMCTGNAGSGMQCNWMNIKGISEGTAVLEVSYDAINVSAGNYGGLFGATDPTRKSLVVVQVGEDKSDLVMKAAGREQKWDTEYDTVYTLGDTAEFSFTATMNDSNPDKAELSTDKGQTWTAISVAEDGTFNATGLVPGNNIIRFTQGEKECYQVVRADKATVSITNKSREGDEIYEGDQLVIKFSGMHTPVAKFSGIYNPGFGSNAGHKNNYDAPEGTTVLGKGGQYDYITSNEMTVTVGKPDENGKVTITNGRIEFGVMGVEDPLGGHRLLDDYGTGTNFSAVNTNHVRCVLPDLTFEVAKLPTAKVTFTSNAENYELKVTNDIGNAAVNAESDGSYELVVGNYHYEITAEGFAKEIGTFSVKSSDVETGKTVNITMSPIGEVWDGTTSTEPATDANGTYLIGTGAELAWFASEVNGGKVTINAILTSDINLGWHDWTPIGNATKKYNGNFNGNSHLIKGLYINETSTTAKNLGLFGYIDKLTVIQKLGVSGSVTFGVKGSSSTTGFGGIVGRMNAGATIKKCYNLADVTGFRATGGICGYSVTNAIITDCYNMGKITATSGGALVGGITGASTSNSSVATCTNCYNVGNIVCPAANTASGGIAPCNSETKQINCYELAGCVELSTANSKFATALTSEELKNISSSLGNSYSADTTNINDGYPVLAWQNTEPPALEDVIAAIDAIGTPVTLESKPLVEAARAKYELLSATDFSKVTNYSVLVDAETTIANIEATVAKIDLLTDPYAGSAFKKLITAAETAYNGLSEETRKAVPNAELLVKANEEYEKALAPVEIKTADDLVAFAERVNNSAKREDLLNAVLVSDIDMTGVAFSPIGKDSSPGYYLGTFDGNNLAITNLTINNENLVGGAIFGAVGADGVIRNLTLKDSNIHVANNAAGIAAINKGKIYRCKNYASISQVELTTTSSGGKVGGYAAGIVSRNSGTVEECANYGNIEGKFTIGGIVAYNTATTINCYNYGNVTAEDSYAGGIAASLYNSTVTNCYNVGTVTVTNTASATAYPIANAATNCFYLADSETDTVDGTIAKSEADMKNIASDLGEAFKSGHCIYPVFSDVVVEEADEEIPATCTKAGKTAGTHCTLCGETIVAQEEIPALGHEYVESEAKVEPTCTEAGKTAVSECSRCHDVIGGEAIEALGHDYVEKEAKVEPTCTEAGKEAVSECSRCHEATGGEAIEALGHDYVEKEAKVEPTCTEAGKEAVSECARCHEATGGEAIEALGHDYVEKEAKVEPTCTEAGKEAVLECSRCHETTGGEAIEALGHKAVEDKAVDATCTKPGLTAGTHCSVCGTVLVAQEEIPALEHSYKVSKEAKEPTCTAAGNTEEKTCETCGKVIGGEAIEALGHDYVEKVAKVEPTCTEAGKEAVSECSRCHETKGGETIEALGHKAVTDEAVDATCSKAGKTEGSHCSVCNEVLKAQEEIPALGHSYKVTKEAKDATCTEAGNTEEKTCETCGKVKGGETIEALGHDYVEKVAKVEPTCTEAGKEAVSECSRCHETKGGETIEALGHKSKTVVTQATMKANGKKVVKCSRCDETLKTTTIYAAKTVKLAKSKYAYDGKKKTPTVVVKNSKGKVLVKGTDYTVSMEKGRIKVGYYKITVKGKGSYSFTKSLTLTIKPKPTEIVKVTPGKKSFTVKWKKRTIQVTGYEIQYSKDSKFKTGNRAAGIKSNKTTSRICKKLKSNTTYYVRVRTYKTVNGKKIYSVWSAKKKVVTK